MDQEKVAFSQQVEVDPGRTGSASPAQPARGSRARESAPGRERRVLVVAPEPFYEDRGTPIAIRSVLAALSELHYEVDLLTYPVGQAVSIPGLQVIRTRNPLGFRRVPIGLSARKLLLDAVLVPTLWRQLKQRRYCCIHAVEEAAFPAVVFGRSLGIPVIYDMQSSLPEQMVKYRVFRSDRIQSLLRACEAWLLRRAEAVVSSAGLLQKVSELAPGKRAREWRFPMLAAAGGDAGAALRAELKIGTDVPVVVYAGTFEPYQGLSTLVTAAGRVVEHIPGTVFVLVGGDGEPAEEIRREVARGGLQGSMRLLGRKARSEMPAYLGMADVLVSPRCYGDNLPLKVFDYLAAGRPIVATDLPAHRALLDESRAILTEPNAAGLARGILQVIRDPARAADLATSARAYAATNLGWHGFVLGVKALYDEVVGQTASSGSA
jgi:glycosyltransferase involved in cell wall biosynthesis